MNKEIETSFDVFEMDNLEVRIAMSDEQSKEVAQFKVNRFKVTAGQYLSLADWMVKNLSAVELNELKDGLCAFNPDSGLEGATKSVLRAFYKAFEEESTHIDGHWVAEWEEEIEDDSDAAEQWEGWSEKQVAMALAISDAMCDHADYSDVNPNA